MVEVEGRSSNVLQTDSRAKLLEAEKISRGFRLLIVLFDLGLGALVGVLLPSFVEALRVRHERCVASIGVARRPEGVICCVNCRSAQRE